MTRRGNGAPSVASSPAAAPIGDYPRVHLSRANANLGMKDYDLAITRYTKFLEQFPLEASCRY